MSSREQFINETHRASFISKGFKVGARVHRYVSQDRIMIGEVIDASSPDVVVRWETNGGNPYGSESSVNYLFLTVRG